MAEQQFITYKGFPLVRKGKDIYYGNIVDGKKTIDEVQALRRIGGKIPDTPAPKHPYYDSEKYKRDQEYLSAPHPSEHVTLRDFWFWFSHTYHDPALPPLGFWRLLGIFGWVVMIIWGLHRLCS